MGREGSECGYDKIIQEFLWEYSCYINCVGRYVSLCVIIFYIIKYLYVYINKYKFNWINLGKIGRKG